MRLKDKSERICWYVKFESFLIGKWFKQMFNSMTISAIIIFLLIYRLVVYGVGSTTFWIGFLALLLITLLIVKRYHSGQHIAFMRAKRSERYKKEKL